MTQIFERPTSRKTTSVPPTYESQWVVTGTTSSAVAKSYALAATPAIVVTLEGTLYRQDLKVEPISGHVYGVTVPYAVRKRETGEYTLSFDTSGGTVHISSSKETIASYAATGTAPDHKQLIGVKGDDVAGADVVIPALKLTVRFKHPQAEVSLPWIKTLASITGTVNSTPFLTFDPGEVLFLGASGSEGSEAETEAAYSFACSKNAGSLTVGGLTGVAKKGHEYLWIAYQDTTDGGRPVKNPQFVYVERVYELTDFTAVLGFG